MTRGCLCLLIIACGLKRRAQVLSERRGGPVTGDCMSQLGGAREARRLVGCYSGCIWEGVSGGDEHCICRLSQADGLCDVGRSFPSVTDLNRTEKLALP